MRTPKANKTMEEIKKARFADHFTIAMATELLDLEKAAADEKRKSDQMAAIMDAAMRTFLGALLVEGRLLPIPGVKGHRLRFPEEWNRVATGQGTEADWASVCSAFGFQTGLTGVFTTKGGTFPTVEEAHAKICAQADSGTYYSVDGGQSRVTDQTVYLRFKDWIPTAAAYGAKGTRIALEDAPVIGPQTGRITLPTGRLLVSDWIRVNGFNEAVGEPEDGPSINSEAGIVAMTLHVLSKGVASFHVGNSSPRVYLRDGGLVIGRQRALQEHDWRSDDEEPEEIEIQGEAGYVITDLWNATIVDVGTLIGLLEGRLGSRKAAKAAYAAYRRKNNDHIVEVEVEPGTYEVHFGPSHREFAKAFRDERLPCLSEIAAYGALIPVAG